MQLGEEEAFDDDVKGDEDDNEDEDEDEDKAASTSGRKGKSKGKGKGKEKASELEPRPKSKKKPAPRARGGKGKAKEVEAAELEPGLERVADEATPGVGAGASKSAVGGEAGPALSPEANQSLPQTIAELEAILPQFFGDAHGIIDEIDPEDEAEVEVLKFSSRPDMARYVELEFYRAKLQFEALLRMDGDKSDAQQEARNRGKALHSLLKRYQDQAAGDSAGDDAIQENPSVIVSENFDYDGDVNMDAVYDAGE